MESAQDAVQRGYVLFGGGFKFQASFSKHLQRRGVTIDTMATNTPSVPYSSTLNYSIGQGTHWSSHVSTVNGPCAAASSPRTASQVQSNTPFLVYNFLILYLVLYLHTYLHSMQVVIPQPQRHIDHSAVTSFTPPPPTHPQCIASPLCFYPPQQYVMYVPTMPLQIQETQHNGMYHYMHLSQIPQQQSFSYGVLDNHAIYQQLSAFNDMNQSSIPPPTAPF